jgi:cytidyltransferase-like protein
MCRLLLPADKFEVFKLENKTRLCRRRFCVDCFPIRLREKATNSWASHIKTKYGLSPSDFEQMGQLQNWRCAICGTSTPPLPSRGRKLPWTAWHIDHDHETGKVRALLCFNCNQLLGQSRDRITVLNSAARYLENHKNSLAYLGGTFDVIHPGHLKLIEWAKNTFGRVVISLNRDCFVSRYKQKPLMNFEERFQILSELRNVDAVIENTGDEDSKPALLQAKPTHIVNGADWSRDRLIKQMTLTEEFLEKQKIKIVIYPDSDPTHSSDIKKRMA